MLSLGWVTLGSYIICCIEKGSINDEADSLVHSPVERTGRGRAEYNPIFPMVYHIFFLYFILYIQPEQLFCVFLFVFLTSAGGIV